MTIDIVVGGAFGDEGKGQICAHLVKDGMNRECPYFFSVRVSGSNAEHRFETPDGARHTGRVLPVAGWVDPSIKMVLGAGHVIKLPSIFSEIGELERLHGSLSGRLFIDAQAGVIQPEHTHEGKATAWRGSTHQGSGQAAAHKVLRDGKFTLAKDCPGLFEYVHHNTPMLMKEWMEDGVSGILEGAQGALLSLNHGYYPFCTSKDVTPAGLLAEAGIPTSRVRNTWAVYRAVPMRVPGNSGPSEGRELRWEELELSVGEIPEEAKVQTDSGNKERVFLWSWPEFRKSVALIGPTHIALTFADWWSEHLVGYSLKELIVGIEKEADAGVHIVRGGPAWDDFTIENEWW
jgi:adenylosuccinate synthase